MNKLRTLIHDQRGLASIEFAFASLFMFGIIIVALDFGFYAQQKMKLGGAVQQAAVLAYNQQTGGTTTAISNYVKAAADTVATPTVAITCNGTSVCGDGKCSCVTAGGGFAVAGSCATTCPGSAAISGNYMKIAATVVYSSMIVPDKYLGGTNMTSSAVVRLQ